MNYQSIFQQYMHHSCEALDRFWQRSTSYNDAFPRGIFEAMIK
jgi:hypothetical protein